VVDVGVAQNHGIDVLRIYRKLAILLSGFVTSSLEQPAVKENAVAVDFDEMLAAGNAFRGAKRCYAHGFSFLCSSLRESPILTAGWTNGAIVSLSIPQTDVNFGG